MPVMHTYDWSISGYDAHNNTWATHGKVSVKTSEFPQIFDMVMRQSFGQLTQGKAVYGKPGVRCVGPYQVTSVIINLSDFKVTVDY